MSYNAETDSYTCAVGRKLVLLSEHPDKNSKNGAILSRYRCEDCCNCHLRSQCSTSKNPCSPKEICVKKQFVEKRETSLENIKSEEGIYLRLCCSIQVEGAFAFLKTDFGFRRFLTRGKKNVKTELLFLALAFNLKKNWMKSEAKRCKTHLSDIKKTA